jgi:hypothetical protein
VYEPEDEQRSYRVTGVIVDSDTAMFVAALPLLLGLAALALPVVLVYVLFFADPAVGFTLLGLCLVGILGRAAYDLARGESHPRLRSPSNRPPDGEYHPALALHEPSTYGSQKERDRAWQAALATKPYRRHADPADSRRPPPSEGTRGSPS